MSNLAITVIAFFAMMLIPLFAYIKLNITYSSMKKKNNLKGITGQEAARKILDNNNLNNIYIVETNGNMTDHFDSQRKVIRLSKDVFNGKSIASIAIAAHEAGHAVQHAEGYKWAVFRSKIVPTVQIGEKASYILIMIGFILGSINFIYAGIAFMLFGLVFQVVTLPCEFDASKRGLKFIEEYNMVEKSESKDAKKMLKAAAYTYIAGLLSTILEILYYVARLSNRRD